MSFFSKLFPSASKGKDAVSFDDERIVVSAASGNQYRMTWDELREVGILTTSEGPIVDDVFWILLGDENKLVVPSAAEGQKELLARLQKLPGFDNEAVIQAMSCATDGRFLCWRREGMR